MRSLLAILLFATGAVAAPVPKQTPKQEVEAKFGKIVDPKGDTNFKMDGKTLVVTLPGKQTRMIETKTGPIDGKSWQLHGNAPQLTTGEGKGDFEIQCTISAKLSETAKPADGKNGQAYLGAGVKFEYGSEESLFLGLRRYAPPEQKTPPHLITLSALSKFGALGDPTTCDALKGYREQNWKIRVRHEQTKLRYYCDFGPPGEVNYSWGDHEYDEKDKVTISLVFIHASDTAHEVRIDDFKITPIAPKK